MNWIRRNILMVPVYLLALFVFAKGLILRDSDWSGAVQQKTSAITGDFGYLSDLLPYVGYFLVFTAVVFVFIKFRSIVVFVLPFLVVGFIAVLAALPMQDAADLIGATWSNLTAGSGFTPSFLKTVDKVTEYQGKDGRYVVYTIPEDKILNFHPDTECYYRTITKTGIVQEWYKHPYRMGDGWTKGKTPRTGKWKTQIQGIRDAEVHVRVDNGACR